MRALLAAVGTRGDVQPALALALELRKLGHAARLCILRNFVDRAKRLGLEAVPIAEHAGIGCVTAVYAPIDDDLDYVLGDHTWLAAARQPRRHVTWR